MYLPSRNFGNFELNVGKFIFWKEIGEPLVFDGLASLASLIIKRLPSRLHGCSFRFF